MWEFLLILLLIVVTGPDIWVAAAISIWQARSWPRYLITALLTSAAVVALRSGINHARWPDDPLLDKVSLYVVAAVFFLSIIGAAIRLGLFKAYDER